MGDRGRVAVKFQGERIRLAAPDYLSPDEQAVWVSIVNDQPAGAFSIAHIPLLEMFVGHVVRSRFLAEQLEAAMVNARATGGMDYSPIGPVIEMGKAIDRENRAASSLATRLRLSPASVFDPKTRGRQNTREGGATKPWDAEDATPRLTQ